MSNKYFLRSNRNTGTPSRLFFYRFHCALHFTFVLVKYCSLNHYPQIRISLKYEYGSGFNRKSGFGSWSDRTFEYGTVSNLLYNLNANPDLNFNVSTDPGLYIAFFFTLPEMRIRIRIPYAYSEGRWVRIKGGSGTETLLNTDPDPEGHWKRIQYESGSETLFLTWERIIFSPPFHQTKLISFLLLQSFLPRFGVLLLGPVGQVRLKDELSPSQITQVGRVVFCPASDVEAHMDLVLKIALPPRNNAQLWTQYQCYGAWVHSYLAGAFFFLSFFWWEPPGAPFSLKINFLTFFIISL